MKVGTDAILLGGWARGTTPGSILDIGTGTGVIALMLAQRFANALVDGVETDTAACKHARLNCARSPWADRIDIYDCSVQTFAPGRSYELVVANPPWFRSSLKPENNARRIARHDDSLTRYELITAAAQLMSSDGRFCLIIPADQESDFIADAAEFGFHCERCCRVCPTPTRPPKRVLLEFSRNEGVECEQSELVVELSRHVYSQQYAELARDFLLKL